MTPLLFTKLRRDMRTIWPRIVLMIVAMSITLTMFSAIVYTWGITSREIRRAWAPIQRPRRCCSSAVSMPPFFRVDRSRSKSTGGYGLGLSICKRVMDAHGGSIAVERQAGQGTSFVLTFPKAAFAKSA